MAERIYDEWDRILEEDRRLTDLFVADFNYHLDAEYCNGDVNCKFDALDSAFEVKNLTFSPYPSCTQTC